MCTKVFYNPIPNTQHRPIGVDITPVITKNKNAFRKRFNFKKAKWIRFTDELDDAISNLAPDARTYDILVQIVNKVARHNIPRGCRTLYVPGLTSASSVLYETYKASHNNDPFDEATISLWEQVTDAIKEKIRRRKKWQKLMKETDMTHSSRKAW